MNGKRFEMFWNVLGTLLRYAFDIFYLSLNHVLLRSIIGLWGKLYRKTDSLSCGSLVNDLAMLYYTERLSEKSLRRVMGLFKIYTDYEFSKDPRTITARATENRKFAVETKFFFILVWRKHSAEYKLYVAILKLP